MNSERWSMQRNKMTSERQELQYLRQMASFNPRLSGYRCPTPTLGQQEIKTQASLLSGRYYKGHDYQLAQGTIVFSTSVHSTIRLRLPGFFKKDNENGMLVQVEMAPGARLRTVCAKRQPRIPFSVPCCCEGSKGVYKTVYPKRRGILYRPFSKRIGLSTG